MFTEPQRELLDAIVLRNVTVNAWVIGRQLNAGIARGMLLAILDVLAQHWRAELDEELARGVRLRV